MFTLQAADYHFLLQIVNTIIHTGFIWFVALLYHIWGNLPASCVRSQP